ncbi:heterocyst development glycosyltransferase HepC [Calothrix rhizosoleniae]|uniref:heterocyst development glycosyltransferase HepC n=1 Tax=Calothrix rhizosoleniae TaxID=888997 RepID=UPI000B4A2D00|nr:heterocyst development glycosyltransferase HepC [Calothrix rhizosoleniae]
MTKLTLANAQDTSIIYQEDQNNSFLSCRLLWRRNQLLVKPSNVENEYLYHKMDCQQLLVDCLNHSPVNLVRIDPQLGEEQLKLWADACQEVNKPIYLLIPSANIKHKISYLLRQWLQQATNLLLAFILFLVLLPFLAPLFIWIHFNPHQSLFTYEWSVGKRGKLFRIIKLCTVDIQQIASNNSQDIYMSQGQKYVKIIIKLMHKYNLDKLPQLMNVLRGEMLLFGSNPCILQDTVSLSHAKQKQLNKMPGVISLSQRFLYSKTLNIDSQIL